MSEEQGLTPYETREILFYKTENGEVRVSLRAKNLLAEEYPMSIEAINLENGKWIYDGVVAHMAGVGRFVMGLMCDIQILESDELRDYIIDYLSNSHILHQRI